MYEGLGAFPFHLFLSFLCVFRLDFFGASMRGVVTSPIAGSDSERVWKPDVPWSRKLTPIQDEEANRKCPTWRSSWIHILKHQDPFQIRPFKLPIRLYEHSAKNTLEFLVQESLAVQPCMFDAAVSRWVSPVNDIFVASQHQLGNCCQHVDRKHQNRHRNIQHHFSVGINIPLKASEKKAKGCKNWCLKLTSLRQLFKLGGGNSNMFYFHPDPWGDDPMWRVYFSNGLKPPTGFSTATFFLVKNQNPKKLHMSHIQNHPKSNETIILLILLKKAESHNSGETCPQVP